MESNHVSLSVQAANPTYQQWADEVAGNIRNLLSEVQGGGASDQELQQDCENLQNTFDNPSGAYNDLGYDDQKEQAILIQTAGDGAQGSSENSDLQALWQSLGENNGPEVDQAVAKLQSDAQAIEQDV